MAHHITTPDQLSQSVTMIKKCSKSGCTVILSHSRWCSHCIAFKPQWDIFEKNPGKGVDTISIEADSYKNGIVPDLYKLLSDNNQMYYPMIILFVDGKRYLYNGERSAVALKSFVASKRKESKAPAAKKPVVKAPAAKKPVVKAPAAKK